MKEGGNLSLFGTIAFALLVLLGTVSLAVLTADGALNLRGVVLGAIFGLWLSLGFLIGHAVYGGKDRRNLKGLAVVMSIALAVGIYYHFGWQLPYMNQAAKPLTVYVEQLAGMTWALCIAGACLCASGFRKAAR